MHSFGLCSPAGTSAQELVDGFAGCLADALSPSTAYLPADDDDDDGPRGANFGGGGGAGAGESPAPGDAGADARAGLVLQLLLDGVQVGSGSWKQDVVYNLVHRGCCCVAAEWCVPRSVSTRVREVLAWCM
jgi:hypothetical protein